MFLLLFADRAMRVRCGSRAAALAVVLLQVSLVLCEGGKDTDVISVKYGELSAEDLHKLEEYLTDYYFSNILDKYNDDGEFFAEYCRTGHAVLDVVSAWCCGHVSLSL
jgi:hypothetical protein